MTPKEAQLHQITSDSKSFDFNDTESIIEINQIRIPQFDDANKVYFTGEKTKQGFPG